MAGSTSGMACGTRSGVATAGAGKAPAPPDAAVRAEGLEKRYGDKRALDGLDLTVHRGTVHGLLGPNGAGKTTVVRILATLLRPDGGRATVAGHEVVRSPQQVRARIGLAGQYAAVDGILTGRQNLEMFGKLFHLGARRARARATELLDQFGLGDAAGKSARTYSGGMRRRLDLAASLILAPEVLFLDEPTTGLDPRGRNEVWESVRGLTATGTTVLLTTQYLDEADQLADRVSVIEHGRTIADGTPAELKRQIGGERLQVVLRDPADLPHAVRTVARVAANGVAPTTDEAERRVGAPVTEGVAALTEVARTLQDEGIGVEDIGLRRPTLDEVFLRLTGRGTAEAGKEAAA
ncbi:ATP-binding cassette domain-containing protein [Streptomyces sp. Isolate_219]|uniref:ATP-binding cassette domain-containing protein n=1 Tax=Streptomyces sp. Isolate_219 TaxID=2950110 RepID=UPI0021C63BF0|nr:ATP-binding cassette domain-containing protein [Streptomyces sp. Isolate_219]MCR8577089.1 ATP-binding cassette domain-containing protein [Streptomyces sp. Isolate_219]